MIGTHFNLIRKEKKKKRKRERPTITNLFYLTIPNEMTSGQSISH